MGDDLDILLKTIYTYINLNSLAWHELLIHHFKQAKDYQDFKKVVIVLTNIKNISTGLSGYKVVKKNILGVNQQTRQDQMNTTRAQW